MIVSSLLTSVKRILKKDNFEPISLEGDGDLFDSFNQKMEDEEFKDDIKTACEKIWKESLEWL